MGGLERAQAGWTAAASKHFSTDGCQSIWQAIHRERSRGGKPGITSMAEMHRATGFARESNMTERANDNDVSAVTRRTGLCFAVLFGALIGMAGFEGVSQAAAPQAPARREEIKEYMHHVIQYAAGQVWNKQGWVTDQSGFHSIFPQNDEEWEEAESASLALAELLGVLSQPHRRLDIPGWEGYVQAARKLSLEAAAAAEKHKETEFMELGTRIDEACEACHIAAGMK